MAWSHLFRIHRHAGSLQLICLALYSPQGVNLWKSTFRCAELALFWYHLTGPQDRQCGLERKFGKGVWRFISWILDWPGLWGSGAVKFKDDSLLRATHCHIKVVPRALSKSCPSMWPELLVLGQAQEQSYWISRKKIILLGAFEATWICANTDSETSLSRRQRWWAGLPSVHCSLLKAVIERLCEVFVTIWSPCSRRSREWSTGWLWVLKVLLQFWHASPPSLWDSEPQMPGPRGVGLVFSQPSEHRNYGLAYFCRVFYCGNFLLWCAHELLYIDGCHRHLPLHSTDHRHCSKSGTHDSSFTLHKMLLRPFRQDNWMLAAQGHVQIQIHFSGP